MIQARCDGQVSVLFALGITGGSSDSRILCPSPIPGNAPWAVRGRASAYPLPRLYFPRLPGAGGARVSLRCGIDWDTP